MTRVAANSLTENNSYHLLRDDEKLIVLHFEKTGGSFVHECLVRHLPSELVCPERYENIAFWSASDLQGYRLISAHAYWRDLKALPGPKRTITVLRDPVERCVSLFEFWNSFTEEAIAAHNLHGPRLARTLGLERFFSAENPMLHQVMNLYTRKLLGSRIGGDHPLGSSPEEQAGLAMQALSEIDYIGVSDSLTPFLLRILKDLDLPLETPSEPVNVTRLNSAKQSDLYESRPVRLVQPAVIDYIEERNASDIILWKSVLAKQARKYSIIRELSCQALPSTQVRQGSDFCWARASNVGPTIFGPYTRLGKGDFRAKFRIRRSTSPQPLSGNCMLQVTHKCGEITLVEKNLPACAVTGVQEALVEFSLKNIHLDVEFRAMLAPGLEVAMLVELERLDGHAGSRDA